MQTLVRQLRWEDLDSRNLQLLVLTARNEDLLGTGLALTPPHQGDISSALLELRHPGSVALRAREPMVICGLHLVPLILQVYDCPSLWTPATRDGDLLQGGDLIGHFSGAIAQLLVAERVLLNFLQKLSGVATLTHSFVQELKGSRTRLLDTRKTTPGYRLLEKYAVACGGGWNHRLGLYDRIMLKDNHLAACGGIDSPEFRTLMQRARDLYPGVPIEVEIDSLAQLPALLDTGANGVLFDNFSTEDLRTGVQLCAGSVFTEASGGIHKARLKELADLGLDFISTGSTVHQATWVDIGLDWEG